MWPLQPSFSTSFAFIRDSSSDIHQYWGPPVQWVEARSSSLDSSCSQTLHFHRESKFFPENVSLFCSNFNKIFSVNAWKLCKMSVLKTLCWRLSICNKNQFLYVVCSQQNQFLSLLVQISRPHIPIQEKTIEFLLPGSNKVFLGKWETILTNSLFIFLNTFISSTISWKSVQNSLIPLFLSTQGFIFRHMKYM